MNKHEPHVVACFKVSCDASGSASPALGMPIDVGWVVQSSGGREPL